MKTLSKVRWNWMAVSAFQFEHQKPPVSRFEAIVRVVKYLFCVALAFIPFQGTSSGEPPDAALREKQGSLEYEAPSEIFDQIARSEYEIHWQEGAGAFMAPNRAHNLRFTFHDDSIAITERKTASDHAPWSAIMRLDSYGREAQSVKNTGLVRWTVENNTAKVECDNLDISYKNDQEGLLQEFLIHNKSPGDGPLRLNFLVERRGVNMDIDTTHSVVYFASGHGEGVMR